MTKARKRVILICIALLCAAAAVFFFPKGRKAGTGTYDELILNGGAEDGENGWTTSAYTEGANYTVFEVREGEGMDGGAAFYIRNSGPNDARFVQTVNVSPDTMYLLSAFVRADCDEYASVDGKTPRGANVSVEGLFVFSDSVYQSEEWRQVRLYGRTGPDQTRLTVYVRLGGYSGETIGEAWFDSVSVRRVDSAEAGYAVWSLYNEPQSAPEEEDGAAGGSAQVILILTAAAFILAVWLLSRRVRGEVSGPVRPRVWLILALLLTAGLILRLVVALSVTGYDVDVSDFRIWADRMYQVGPAGFYKSTWCDYPPGYLMILWVLGALGHFTGGTSPLLVKMPSILCDLAAALVLFRTARKKGLSDGSALALCAAWVFNPMTLMCGAAWGQGDSVMTLLLMMTALCGMGGVWEAALPLYGLAVLVKPQSLMFGPMGLAALALAFISARGDRTALKALFRRAAVGFGIMAALMLLILLPFIIGQGGVSWLISLYGNTMGSYAFATVNGCNWYYIFGLNWAGIDAPAPALPVFACLATVLLPFVFAAMKTGGTKRERVGVPAAGVFYILLFTVLALTGELTVRVFGYFVIALSLCIAAWAYIRGARAGHLPLCGAALLCLMFSSGTMMHERYLFPAAALLLLAYFEERDRRVLWVFALVSASCFLNAGCVLDRNIRIGGASAHLAAPVFGLVSDMAAAETLASALNVLSAFAASLLMCFKCVPGSEPLPWPAAVAPEGEESGRRFSPVAAAAKRLVARETGRRADRKDALIVLSVTALYCAFTLFNLGSAKAPQTFFTLSPGETTVLDLGGEKTFKTLVYQGIHYNNVPFTLEVSSDGENYGAAAESTATPGDCFKWRYINPSYSEYYSGRYVRITSNAAPNEWEDPDNYLLTLFEVLFRDADGKALPYAVSQEARFLNDEQDTLDGEPDWYNSAYFDEIYHARTGYELLHKLPIYEWTHPPLGKILIAACVSVFGMTPFGWRFAGAMMGVFMLPAMYLTGRLLFKKRFGGVAAMGLMLFDFMHFTQTRIATIDSFVVCFIMWSVYFMLRWFLLDLWERPFWKSLLDLFLSGVFIGLAIASKWTGCYAGVGLAAVFFWGLFRRIMEVRAARKAAEDETAGKDGPLRKTENARAETAAGEGAKRLCVTVACCFGFFVFIPLLFYYLAYIPFLAANGSLTGSLGENIHQIVIQCQGMLSYHSQPGLGMDHFFYTPWYDWPLIKKPMWYFATSFAPEGASRTILSFGNPAVWWTGGAAMVLLMLILCRRAFLALGPALPRPAADAAPAEGAPAEGAEDGAAAKNGLAALCGRLRALFSAAPPEDDPVPALIVISFLAQFLPWVLVSRGTYIYHYFPSVPFIILALSFLLSRLEERSRRAGILALAAFLFAAFALFIAFFPYISGVTASKAWLDSMKWFQGWLYY